MSPIFDADVVIVGAGLSGLQAARSLANAGITTVLLEARSRIGGKTFSVVHENNVGVADLGAEWLNDTTHPLVYRLARELDLQLSEVKVQGDAVLHGLDGNITRHIYGQQAPVSVDVLELRFTFVDSAASRWRRQGGLPYERAL